MNDTCYRRIQTLRSIPSYPSRISTSQLVDKLKGEGIDIHVRSLQRDLNSLAKLFEIENDGNKDIPGWYWKPDAEKLEIPKMEPAVALSFRMVKFFLEKFMPPSTFLDLKPYFSHSEKLLSNLSSSHLQDWSSKVALVSRNQPLVSPTIDPVVLSEVYQALLSEVQIEAQYQPRGKEIRDYTINPLGIVVVDQIIYLVGTLWEYQDVKQFALHRFRNAKLTTNTIHESKDFRLTEYIDQGHFEYLVDKHDEIKLKLIINKGLAQHLSENKVSIDQEIIKQDNSLILTATTKDTLQLRWWLMGFGDAIEVIEPKELRQEFVSTIQNLNKIYNIE